MAFLNEENKLEIEIPTASVNTGFTVYEITVHVGPVWWKVAHRYNDFQQLHQHLSCNHGVPKHLLPPKKMIGNKDPAFVEKRRLDLQSYLQGVVSLMQQAVGEELAEFLELSHYEVLHLRQQLAMRQSEDAEAEYSVLELHAVSGWLQCPTSAVVASHHSSALAEMAATTRGLTVHGSAEPWRSSNIIPNELEFNFNLFKKLQTVTLQQCNVLKITSASTIRKTVTKLNAPNCGVSHVCDLLLCDAVHRHLDDSDSEMLSTLPRWQHLKDLDLSNNQISSIDISVSLCSRLETINLCGNKLTDLKYLHKLPYLISVVVSNNCLSSLPALHTRLGNLVHLDLSRNALSSLSSLSCLYSLVSLDVSCNSVAEVSEVRHVAALPCLEALLLTGNPVASVVDYRTKVLECFGARCSEVCLDNERPTQRELDKVAVLAALRAARGGHRAALPTLATPPTPALLQQQQQHAFSITLAGVPDQATAVEEATRLE